MYLKQGDLFWGMNKDFVKKATDLAVNMPCKDGDTLFSDGDPADHFYILLRGKVALNREMNGDQPYMAQEPGEIIGWSSLIRRREFTASATCIGDTELLKVERDPFLSALDKTPADKTVLFERVAKMLGEWLLEMNPAAA